MPLINWLWLEDLLVRAAEEEVRAFGEAHPAEEFFAFCLEFDGLQGEMAFSYGTRAAVEVAATSLRAELGEAGFCYRTVELQPEKWEYRSRARHTEANWQRAKPPLDAYRQSMKDDPEPQATEFLWLRFEYLVECVVRRLIDRDAFRYLPREREFIAYTLCDEERMEEVEDRLCKLYPAYSRATFEFVPHPRPGELEAGMCDGTTCGGSLARAVLLRCTHCQEWLCEACREEHNHPELAERRPFFV